MILHTFGVHIHRSLFLSFFPLRQRGHEMCRLCAIVASMRCKVYTDTITFVCQAPLRGPGNLSLAAV